MFEGMFRSFLAVLNMTPEQAKAKADEVVTAVTSIDKRLADIERRQMLIMKTFNVEELQEIERLEDDAKNAAGNLVNLAGRI